MEFRMYDNDTVKFEHEGGQFCLHVQHDDDPMNPRTDWDHPGTYMACWHRHYRLGDDVGDDTPEEFWQRLVRENVPESEVMVAAKAGKLTGIRIEKCEGHDNLVNIYEICQWRSPIGDGEPEECLEYEEVSEDTAVYYLLDDLTIGHCMTLMEPYAIWLPLWLYDHSGITMSCGVRRGQFADCWDSGQVGWIYTTKDNVVKEIGYSENDWRECATRLMEAEVKEYDQYLTGDVYGFTLLKKADTEAEDDDSTWEEVDSCWGFYGSDIFANGIAGSIAGLTEAIEGGDYEEGEAKLVVTSHYTYPTKTR